MDKIKRYSEEDLFKSASSELEQLREKNANLNTECIELTGQIHEAQAERNQLREENKRLRCYGNRMRGLLMESFASLSPDYNVSLRTDIEKEVCTWEKENTYD